MEVHIRQVGPIAHALLVGELTGGQAEEEVHKAINTLIESGCRYFALDLSQVTYINSLGLGGLVRLYKLALRNKGDMCLANPRPHIRQVLSRFSQVPIFGAVAADKIREWTEGMGGDGTPAKANAPGQPAPTPQKPAAG